MNTLIKTTTTTAMTRVDLPRIVRICSTNICSFVPLSMSNRNSSPRSIQGQGQGSKGGSSHSQTPHVYMGYQNNQLGNSSVSRSSSRYTHYLTDCITYCTLLIKLIFSYSIPHQIRCFALNLILFLLIPDLGLGPPPIIHHTAAATATLSAGIKWTDLSHMNAKCGTCIP